MDNELEVYLAKSVGTEVWVESPVIGDCFMLSP